MRLLAILNMRDVELDLQLAADFADMEACAIRAGGMRGRIASRVSRKASMPLIIERSSWST